VMVPGFAGCGCVEPGRTSRLHTTTTSKTRHHHKRC